MKYFRKSLAIFLLCSFFISVGCSSDPDSNQSNNRVDANSGDNNIHQDPDDDVNACSGNDALLFEGVEARPGDSCGKCGGGFLECDGKNRLVCGDDDSQNACGGCSILEGSPGAECGEAGVWVCNVNGNVFCNEGELPDVIMRTPEVNEVEAHFEVDTNSAVFKASFEEIPNTAPIDDHGFCWSLEPNPTLTDSECGSLGPVEDIGEFSLEITTLMPGHQYYVRIYAQIGINVGALTEGTVVYSDDIIVVTKAKNIDGETLIAGEMQSELVSLSWDGIDGANEYVIYRDGEEIARVTENSFIDTGAIHPPAPAVVENVQANGYTNRIVLSWDEARVDDGPVHEYQVQAIYPARSSELSTSVQAYRSAAPLIGYELSINGEAFEDIGVALTYDDFNAPANTLSIPIISASQGVYATHVALLIEDMPTVSSTSVSYTLRAFNVAGSGEASHEVYAARTSGSVEYQWEQALQDNGTSYSAIAGATEISHNDTTAPATGEVRFYRLAVSAQGTETAYSESIIGYRAAKAEVSTLAINNVEMNAATFNGSLTTLGVPAASAHGFCYRVGDDPVHDGDSTCVDLGPAENTGNFSDTIENLSAGTEYFVRAFATTVAGTSYGNSQVFWTVPEQPVVNTTARRTNITVNWSAVSGSSHYIVKRDGEELTTVNASTYSFVDTEAELAPAPGPVIISDITTNDTNGVLIEWNAASVMSATEHVYEVIAINPDSLESLPGQAFGQLRAQPISGYWIKIGDSEWQPVGDENALSYFDADAPRGHITPGPVTVTQGTEYNHIAISASVQSVSTPAPQTYFVRAANASGFGVASETEGQRALGQEYHITTSYSDIDAISPFGELHTETNLTGAYSHNDTLSHVDGSNRFYKVTIAVDGAETFESNVYMGYRAALPQISTVAQSNVEKTTATLNGIIDVVGRPDIEEHGFCYGSSPNPDHNNKIACTTLGTASAPGALTSEITDLTPGTKYYARAYATSDAAIVNNAQTIYGNPISFWTKTEAPTNITATDDQHDKVIVSWDAVTGASHYMVYRDDEVLAENISTLSHDDITADEAPQLAAPGNFSATQGTKATGITLTWEAPELVAGTSHNYQVVALNADGLKSVESVTVQGQRVAEAIDAYELKIGTGSWAVIGDVFTFNDFDAPNAQVIFNSLSASQGSVVEHVELNAIVPSISQALTQNYELRAINGSGRGLEASTAGYRDYGTPEYQWVYSDNADDLVEQFDVLNGATALVHYDATANATGAPRRYALKLSGTGIEPSFSGVISGNRAVVPVFTVSAPTHVEKYTATFNGEITTLSVPAETSFGFCYATHGSPDNNDSCVTATGSAQRGGFEASVTGLAAGTKYYVRAFITNSKDTYYSAAIQSFWTKTGAPQNVVTTRGVNKVSLSWNAVQGAEGYDIYRRESTDENPPEKLGNVDGFITSYDDTTAEGGLPDAVVLATPDTKHSDYILLEWEPPTIEDGIEYEYFVLAVNADGLESTMSDSAVASALGSDIVGYQLQIDDGTWVDIVGATVHDGTWTYLDTSAPAGFLAPGSITVSKGTDLAQVSLSTTDATVDSDGATRNYRVRATNEDTHSVVQPGAHSNQVSSNRNVDISQVSYEWQSQEGGAPVDFFTLGQICVNNLTCSDPTNNGAVWNYRLKITAPGAHELYTTPQEGAIAVLAFTYAQQPPSSVNAGADFDVHVQLINQFGDAFGQSNINVTLKINKNAFTGDATTITTDTNSEGLAIFNDMSIADHGKDYRLTASFTDSATYGGETSQSYNFDINDIILFPPYSSIEGTTSAVSNGIDTANIAITLKNSAGEPIVGVVPEFKASGDSNSYNTCSMTNANGESTCSMASLSWGTKSVWVSGPASLVYSPTPGSIYTVDGSVTFDYVCSGNDFQSGDGIVDAYTICNVEQFNSIGTNSLLLDKDFVLVEDIDFEGEELTPIGSGSIPFSGHFDGAGHVLSNIDIELNENYVGVFRAIGGSDTVVENLGIETINVSSNGSIIGGLVGELRNEATLKNVYVNDAQIATSEHDIGGLAGVIRNGGFIENSYAEGAVSGVSAVGGLVGAIIDGGEIFASYSDVEVTATIGNGAGGIAGVAFDDALISNVYVLGDIEVLGASAVAGGIVGATASTFVMSAYIVGNMSAPAGATTGATYGVDYQGSNFFSVYYPTSGTVCESCHYNFTSFLAVEDFGIEASFSHGFNFNDIWKIACGLPRFQWQNFDEAIECPP